MTGYEIARPAGPRVPSQATVKKTAPKPFPRDFDDELRDIITAVRPFTTAGNEKLHALVTATRYVRERGVAGAVVECGVSGSGSMQAVARALIAGGERDRDLYLFDTALDQARADFGAVAYPSGHLHFVPGPLEETVPGRAPGQIALLRIDTDDYAPTRHQLDHLYPRLAPGGVLVLDDYGWWKGARQATDDWLRESGAQLVLWRAGGGRVAVKP
ncbi:TylF/MycF/NovP-related O-methyltransferase [Kineosporia succinea]|uniref:O-methyltransferase YrrM n=1 Tax=Kineosporia succinea TaxID=84632 RepID=A0ABT9PD36_9ACTN|nr:TylF/MycF/NovP-related O-methyltransferase [Kineosporia succinea]MDP9830619.1 hypothetical protein [Kineosporia succinea]